VAFKPPSASAGQLAGISFDQAVDFAPAARARFDAFDKTAAGKKDPSMCKALLRFPNGGPAFWSSKMAVDADGPPAGKGLPGGSLLDPDNGQDDTSFQFPKGGGGLPAEAIPYIVLPRDRPGGKKPFDPAISIGDLAIVIFGNKITAAICGDVGPVNKIGEASIRVHEDLRQQGVPDPCVLRDGKGNCLRIHDVSVEQDVLFFVFPDSGFGDELTSHNLETLVTARAFGLFNALRGAG
jgi:hypothetical protein